MLTPRIAQAFGLTTPSAICRTILLSRQPDGSILAKVTPERVDETVGPEVFHHVSVARNWAAGASIIHGLPVVDRLKG